MMKKNRNTVVREDRDPRTAFAHKFSARGPRLDPPRPGLRVSPSRPSAFVACAGRRRRARPSCYSPFCSRPPGFEPVLCCDSHSAYIRRQWSFLLLRSSLSIWDSYCNLKIRGRVPFAKLFSSDGTTRRLFLLFQRAFVTTAIH